MTRRGVKAPGSRLLRTSVVLAALLVLVSTVSAAGAASRADQSSQATVKRSHVITLVTGDRVVLNVLSNGKQTATVANAAGKSRTTPFKSFHAVQQNGDVYAFPVELGPYLGQNLDKELFNLSKLVEQGFADKASSTTPLIVRYRADSTRRSLPTAVAKTTELETINAIAGRERKALARRFGQALRTQLMADAPAIRQRNASRLWRTGPFAGIQRIYLDQKVKTSLAESVPQIGAPQAWAAGFDGTGINVAVLNQAQGIGFAIPIKRVAEKISEMFSPESLDSIWFGARVRPGTLPLVVASDPAERDALLGVVL